ncbi:MAG: type I DNA topoisomerase [Desulfovibrio sp.]|jgi:DNA topoisomerase-1|nr:type I DNA topoisomerase [Desulfovibrio sp.]
MAKNLIIVESPAKVKTIGKFLGKDYKVRASVGHIMDLPRKSLAVDEQNGFTPRYEIIPGKEKVVEDLKKAAAGADNIYLAPDPDREGEAIAWHIATVIAPESGGKNIARISFNEITRRAVEDALLHPKPLNADLYDAQQARRVLDRLVGYKISPLLWKKVKRGISAGRVQSVALRLLAERDAARKAFVPEEYWQFRAHLKGAEPPPFRADLHKVGGKKPAIHDAAAADALEKKILGRDKPPLFAVDGVEVKKREKTPPPPFTTSSMQQAAHQRLGYTAKKTMSTAQRLYEGVDLGEGGVKALITYMRTDSVRVSEEARAAAEEYIVRTLGTEYYPAKARRYKTGGSAQDAHEAVRPVDVNITPESLKGVLSSDQQRLYGLIWTRFMASQTAAAKVEDTVVLASRNGAQFRARGERVLFPGFYVFAPQKSDDAVELPPIAPGASLELEKLEKEQKFTQPPPSYNEASLVRELEEKGIGRPSTYASIIATLQDRGYAGIKDKHFEVTDLGHVVCDMLIDNFVELMDIGFTAQMEERLDKVADGKENWAELLGEFSKRFNPVLEKAAAAINSVKGGMPSGLSCPDCNRPLQIKFGKSGAFMACSGYPECRFTSDFTRDDKGEPSLVEREKAEREVVGKCPDCGGDLLVKRARTGSRFIACGNYPACRHTESYSTGVPCPVCGQGELAEKSSRRGKIFYSCSRYPACDFAVWDPPLKEACPKCGFGVLGLKKARGLTWAVCPNKACGFKRSAGESG